MLPVLQIGPLAIQTPGLILLIGLWAGLTLAEKHSQKHKIHPDNLYNLVLIALVAGVIGGRLAYAGQNYNAFASSPSSLISINPGLFDPFIGVAIGIIASIIYGQRKSLALWPTLDALTPLFASILIAISLSNLASGRGFGSVSNVFWAIEIWGASRHPTQIYEALAAIAILIRLWPTKFEFKKIISGHYFMQFGLYAALARLLLEGFRGDSSTLPNGMRLEQIWAWIIVGLTLWGLTKLQQQSSKKGMKNG